MDQELAKLKTWLGVAHAPFLTHGVVAVCRVWATRYNRNYFARRISFC